MHAALDKLTFWSAHLVEAVSAELSPRDWRGREGRSRPCLTLLDDMWRQGG